MKSLLISTLSLAHAVPWDQRSIFVPKDAFTLLHELPKETGLYLAPGSEVLLAESGACWASFEFLDEPEVICEKLFVADQVVTRPLLQKVSLSHTAPVGEASVP